MLGISQHRSFLVRRLVFGHDTFVFLIFSGLSAHHLQTVFSEQQELRTDVTFTHREVCFLEVWRRGTEKEVFAGCWTCFSKAFLLFFNIKLQTVAPWCVQAFVMDTNSNMDVNTAQTLLQSVLGLFLIPKAFYAVPALFPVQLCTVVGFFLLFLSLL